MLITKIVKKNITPRCANYYRELGYIIPKKINRKGVQIEINVKDLPKNSKDKIQYKCDCCGKIYTTNYGVYINHLHEDKYYCKYCVGKVLNSGSNCYMWNNDLTEEDRIDRRLSPKCSDWSKKVLARDKYTCRKCGKNNGNMQAHHLDGWNWCKEKRYEVSNGVCLCNNCHYNFHSMYGHGNNTKEQFEEWIEKPLDDILDYDGEVIIAKQIICLETKEVKLCKDFNGGNVSHIYDVCNGKDNVYNGKHCMWYKDYLKSTDKEILNKLSLKRKTNAFGVVCIERKLLFETLKDGGEYFNKNSSMISNVLNKKQDTFAGYHWCKLSEYQGNINDLYKVSHEECINSNDEGLQKDKIVCVEKKILFNSLKDIKNYFHFKTIGRICTVMNDEKYKAYSYHWCTLQNYKGKLEELVYID